MSLPCRATRARADRRGVVGMEQDGALLGVDPKVLDDKHRVVVADRRLQRSLGVGRARRRDDLQSRRGGEPPVEALRVLRRELVARPVGRADDQWTAQFPAEHRSDLGGVVDDLVHRDEQEVHRHDFDHRALAEHRGPDARADEALLGDRRVAHALGPELVEEAGGDLVGAIDQLDLLVHEKHAVVARKLLAQRQPQRLAVRHHRGRRPVGGRAH
jgi:hypothetical protein